MEEEKNMISKAKTRMWGFFRVPQESCKKRGKYVFNSCLIVFFIYKCIYDRDSPPLTTHLTRAYRGCI